MVSLPVMGHSAAETDIRIINLNANYFYLRFVYFCASGVAAAFPHNKNACVHAASSGEYKTE
jgi:hypothetical protein